MTESSQNLAASTAEQIDSVHSELGRCLLLYQTIEQVLKLFLPFVRATEQESLQNIKVDWRELLDSKRTLGALIQLFGERSYSSNPQLAATHFKGLVEQRNEVIHHFSERPFAPLRTELQVSEALECLRLRRTVASQFLSLFREQAMAVLSDEDVSSERN